MSSSTTLQAFSILCLAITSVAGQWSGNYNTTAVSTELEPLGKCLIQSLNTTNNPWIDNRYPCTCTGGKVLADCTWQNSVKMDGNSVTMNGVRDADCKCALTGLFTAFGYPDILEAHDREQPRGVTKCVCDAVAGERGSSAEGLGGCNSTDRLVVPAPNCWCPAESLQEKSGLSGVDGSQAVPEKPPCPST